MIFTLVLAPLALPQPPPPPPPTPQVLGDDGRLYVPAENVDIYREEVLPLATMITPNQYEAELLSGVTILTEEDAVRACVVLHSRYCCR